MKMKLLVLPLVSLMSLVACSKEEGPDRADIDPSKSSFTVGILQYAPADALELARTSFKKALDESEYIKGIKTINYIERFSLAKDNQDATYAKSLVTNCDLMLGIATPSAAHLKSARDEAGKKQPLLFTAVTDPVDAKLAKAYPHHDGSVTGTSDDNPVEEQVKLIKRIMTHKQPSEIRFGVFYTSSETNSAVQARRAQQTAIAEGITNVTIHTCTSDADIEANARWLASRVDVMYIPTDNNLASHMNVMKSVVNEQHVLCIVGEEGMLNGGHITYSVSYSYLGRRCGEMAALILSGTKQTHEIDIEKSLNPDDWNKVYNSNNIAEANLGYSLPADILSEFTDVANV